MLVGVFPGSFDPPHVGHVEAIEWVISRQICSRVIVVANQSPNKQHTLTRKNAASLLAMTIPESIRDSVLVEVLEGEMTHPPKEAQVMLRGVRDLAEVPEQAQAITHIFKRAKEHDLEPLPVLLIPHLRIGTRQSSIGAVQILFGANPDSTALRLYLFQSVAEVLLSAREQVVPLDRVFSKTSEIWLPSTAMLQGF